VKYITDRIAKSKIYNLKYADTQPVAKHLMCPFVNYDARERKKGYERPGYEKHE